MLKYLQYVLECQWFTVRYAIYLVHSFLVFLAKPGARYIVPIVVIGSVYYGRDYLRSLFGSEVDSLWQDVVPTFIGRNLTSSLFAYRIEISAIVVLICFVLVFLLFASMLRPVIGAFLAPKRPLPPDPPFHVPDTKVYTVDVKRLLTKKRYKRLSNGLDTLSQGLPVHLQQVMQHKPSPRSMPLPGASPHMPPAPPSGSAPATGQGAAASSSQSQMQPSKRPVMPPPPTVAQKP